MSQSLIVLSSPKKLLVPPFQATKFVPDVALVQDTIKIPISIIKQNNAPPVVQPVVKPTVGVVVAKKPVVNNKESSPFEIKKEPAKETEVEI